MTKHIREAFTKALIDRCLRVINVITLFYQIREPNGPNAIPKLDKAVK